jgi:lipopolysaccharide/colanic/teichoic acid biosynthesis glycosyltransferase
MRDDVDLLYAAMDLFVLPSHREGFPRAAMEASAMGLPVIASDIRGCREVVEHGRNGLLVPVRDPAALASALAAVGADAEMRERMGKEGRRIAAERFDEREVVAKVMEAYRETHYRKAIAVRKVPRREGRDIAKYLLFRRLVKRSLDLLIALAILVLSSPLLLVIALAVRVILGRPVIYRQRRPGLHGTPFTIYKFRTMTNESGSDGEPLPDNRRMTSFGRLLRRTSLDELPELFNVMKGDMSLVGPRPLLMEYMDRYNSRQSLRHEMKPGLTGWSQVSGRNFLSWPEKLELDVWYVENWSLRLDLRILAATIRTVMSGSGITEPGHATASPFLGNQGDL